MFSKWRSIQLLAISAAALMTLAAQETPLDQGSVKINLPPDGPLALAGIDLGQSRAVSRGAAVELDLHMSLALRNVSQDTIRGVTLLVLAQEVTPGGMASVARVSLNAAPGEAFPVGINLVLLRPGRNTAGPLVQVDLDGVLFKSLAFYGQNRKDSRRALTAYETEAQRDRQYFKKILASYGQEGLRNDVMASLGRQAERPRLNVRVSRGPSVSSAALAAGDHRAQFAFLQFPDEPVEPIQGSAQISGNEARSPDIEIRNRSGKPVSYVEIGWIVRDPKGAEFMAASVPASGPGLDLRAGQNTHVLRNLAMQFTNGSGEPVAIAGMTGFVSQVAYTDGRIWVPDRASLQNQQLLRVLAPSTEEQRLTELYKTKGIKALIDELNKF